MDGAAVVDVAGAAAPKPKPVEGVAADGAVVVDVSGAEAPKLKPFAAAGAAEAGAPRVVTIPVVAAAGKAGAKAPPVHWGTEGVEETAAGGGKAAAAVGRERPEASFREARPAADGAFETARENAPCAGEGTGPTIGAPSCAGVGCCGCELARI